MRKLFFYLFIFLFFFGLFCNILELKIERVKIKAVEEGYLSVVPFYGDSEDSV